MKIRKLLPYKFTILFFIFLLLAFMVEDIAGFVLSFMAGVMLVYMVKEIWDKLRRKI
jgi:zinc transporter ZupT